MKAFLKNKLRFFRTNLIALSMSFNCKLITLNSFIIFMWWLLYNPGFFSIDSFGVLEMARIGPITSSPTAVWAITVKFLTFSGAHPEIATLFFSQLLGLSLSIFSITFLKSKRLILCTGIICATPVVGAMGITLWHDIPMTAGFFLALAGFQKLRTNQKGGVAILFVGVFFSSFRYNGLPTLLVFLVFLFFFLRNWKALLVSLAIVISMGVVNSNLNSHFNPVIPTQSDGFINWMRYDLSCYAARSDDEIFFKKQFLGKADKSFWSSEEACTWFNRSLAFEQRSKYVDGQTPKAWLELAMKDPLFVLNVHLQRNAYLNPIPIYGLPSMPFIHTSIEKPDLGIEFLNSELTENLRFYPRIWNYFNFIFGFSGLWLFVILTLSVWRRNFNYALIGLLGVVLTLGLFIFAIIPDGRFALFILISGQLILLVEIVETFIPRIKLPEVTSSMIPRKLPWRS
jgi:hypothetical protein